MNDNEKYIYIIMFLLGALAMAMFALRVTQSPQQDLPQSQWEFQSIDTMKYSRDLAREKLKDTNYAASIDKQIERIAATGATHVAIGTPYDEEFKPILKLWVASARSHGLNVWFRGNWSGWERWFDYEKIGRDEHITKTKQFILENPDLFEDGDAFSSCPECENGSSTQFGDPNQVRDYRVFLINEYTVTKAAFAEINKDVKSNYFSMNADVAKAVMNPETTAALDGLVVIDHYVRTPEQLARDVVFISEMSQGDIVLGEIGVPIPDIHGNMTEDEQRIWMEEAFTLLAPLPQLKGINYWTHMGGSTELWTGKGEPKEHLKPLTAIYGGMSK